MSNQRPKLAHRAPRNEAEAKAHKEAFDKRKAELSAAFNTPQGVTIFKALIEIAGHPFSTDLNVGPSGELDVNMSIASSSRTAVTRVMLSFLDQETLKYLLDSLVEVPQQVGE